MLQDQHGLPLSTSSIEAAVSFDRTILGYLKYRTDTPQHLARTIAADPDFGLAHCLAGYFAMLSYKLANVPLAAEEARTARFTTAKATARERAWQIPDRLFRRSPLSLPGLGVGGRAGQGTVRRSGRSQADAGCFSRGARAGLRGKGT